MLRKAAKRADPDALYDSPPTPRVSACERYSLHHLASLLDVMSGSSRGWGGELLAWLTDFTSVVFLLVAYRFQLGMCYEDGVGTPKSVDEAVCLPSP